MTARRRNVLAAARQSGDLPPCRTAVPPGRRFPLVSRPWPSPVHAGPCSATSALRGAYYAWRMAAARSGNGPAEQTSVVRGFAISHPRENPRPDGEVMDGRREERSWWFRNSVGFTAVSILGRTTALVDRPRCAAAKGRGSVHRSPEPDGSVRTVPRRIETGPGCPRPG